jgi:hypothetical protein
MSLSLQFKRGLAIFRHEPESVNNYFNVNLRGSIVVYAEVMGYLRNVISNDACSPRGFCRLDDYIALSIR